MNSHFSITNPITASNKDIEAFNRILYNLPSDGYSHKDVLEYIETIPLDYIHHYTGRTFFHSIVRFIENKAILEKAIAKAKENNWLDLSTPLLETPLVDAAVYGNFTAVELLIKAGADFSVKVRENIKGVPKFNIFACAARNPTGQLNFLELVKLFSEMDLKIDQQDALFFLLSDYITFTNQKPLTLLQEICKNAPKNSLFYERLSVHIFGIMMLLRNIYGVHNSRSLYDTQEIRPIAFGLPALKEMNDDVYHCELHIFETITLSGTIGPGVNIKIFNPEAEVTFNGNCNRVRIITCEGEIKIGAKFRGDITDESSITVYSKSDDELVVSLAEGKNTKPSPKQSITRFSLIRGTQEKKIHIKEGVGKENTAKPRARL